MALETRSVEAWRLAAVYDRADALNDRAEKLGLGRPVAVTVGERWTVTDEVLGTVTDYVDVSFDTAPVALDGDWDLVALFDFGTADTPLVYNFGADAAYSVDDATRECEHCGYDRRRNRVYVLGAADGRTVRVGSTCAADFLGHDPAKVVRFAEDVAASGFDGEPDRYPTLDYVRAAAQAVATWGFVKTAQAGATRDAALRLLTGRGLDAQDKLDLDNSTTEPVDAAAAVAWAADLDARSDFDENLRAVAASEWVGPKGLGLLAYLPVAYDRHLAQEAERVERAAQAAEADPVPEGGRTRVTGVVLSTKVAYSAYGETLKMTVLDDRGFRVWSTVPAAIDTVEVGGGWRELARGDRVAFDAALTRSDDDETFGFAKRPTKAELLAAADAATDKVAA